MEAEFVAYFTCNTSCLLNRFLEYLGMSVACEWVLVNCDSQAVIAYTKYPKFYCNTKHIDTKYNILRDMITCKEVNMKYISTCKMVADRLSKPMPRDVFIGYIKAQVLCKY